MWALQWGITGSILTYIPLYFKEQGLDDSEMGPLMAISAIGLWIAPFVVGQICDRWLATEKYLAIAHFVGGVTLIFIPFVQFFLDELIRDAVFQNKVVRFFEGDMESRGYIAREIIASPFKALGAQDPVVAVYGEPGRGAAHVDHRYAELHIFGMKTPEG